MGDPGGPVPGDPTTPVGAASSGQAPFGQPSDEQAPYGPLPPPGQVPYGQAPYGAPPAYGVPYGYGPPQYEHPQGTTILVLGILGIVACQLVSPFAWVMGNRVLAEIDANPAAYSNRGLVVAGRICGIVGSVLLGLSLVFGVAYLLFVLAVIGTSA